LNQSIKLVERKDAMNMEIVKLSETAKTPRRATRFSACYDLSANFRDNNLKAYSPNNEEASLTVYKGSVSIPPGFRVLIPTGLILKIPGGHHVKVYSRSGLALKKGLFVANSVGVIDEDYPDELFVMLYNSTTNYVDVADGDRVGQMELCNSQTIRFMTDDGDDENDSNAPVRKGGLGSTGS
jgi:dUTP pyrophosphatase